MMLHAPVHKGVGQVEQSEIGIEGTVTAPPLTRYRTSGSASRSNENPGLGRGFIAAFLSGSGHGRDRFGDAHNRRGGRRH